MSNKIVKSKKKNTISKHNRIDKNKKSIIICFNDCYPCSPDLPYILDFYDKLKNNRRGTE